MFCGECGIENPETNRFCINCGKPLKKAGSGVSPHPAVSGPAPVSPLGAAPPITAPAHKRKRNWTGIAGLICGILSWIILTAPLAVLAIVLGAISLYKTHKEAGKTAFSAIAAIVIAIGALTVTAFIW